MSGKYQNIHPGKLLMLLPVLLFSTQLAADELIGSTAAEIKSGTTVDRVPSPDEAIKLQRSDFSANRELNRLKAIERTLAAPYQQFGDLLASPPGDLSASLAAAKPCDAKCLNGLNSGLLGALPGNVLKPSAANEGNARTVSAQVGPPLP